MDIWRTFTMLFSRRRRILTLLLTVITSVTTITVVHRCTMVDTVRIQTAMPVRKVAQAVQGTVVASAELRLPRRDTVVVHDTILTTRVVTRWGSQRVATAGGVARGTVGGGTAGETGSTCPPRMAITRTANFRDSTFAGIVSGVVTAPPDSGPLGITYHVTRPAFAPTVAFLQTKGQPVVTVSWQGEQVTLEHVVFRPSGSPWVRYVEAMYQPLTRTMLVGGTVGVRLGGMGEVDVGVTQPMALGMGPTMVVSVRRNL
jgi:hypothetical protein